MHGLRRQIIFYGATVLRSHHKLLFGPVVARVWPIIAADVSSPVAVCLLCCGCLGPAIVGGLRLGSDIGKEDSSSNRNNPSKTFGHDVVLVIGDRE